MLWKCFYLAAVLFLFLLSPASAKAQLRESVLYSFPSVVDGEMPYSNLVFDSQGNLYGTTYYGGNTSFCTLGCGVVFELSPPASGTGAWSETLIYSFGQSDGANPQSGVVFDSKGNLYGTTRSGGAFGVGAVFKLEPPTDGVGPWSESLLYSFNNGSDGGSPVAGLIFDSNGNLYGTATLGGRDGGVVFELSPPAGGSGPWTETTLYGFTGGSDGGEPLAGVIFDSHGNLYGTTYVGGANNNAGLVFELAPPSSGNGAWTETVLYNFCTISDCDDGANPYAGSLIFDSHGNLYGTTSGTNGGVVAFELSPPSGSSGNWTETVIYPLCTDSDCSGANGAVLGGLIFDSRGNLYGAAAFGGNTSGSCGSSGCGNVFELSPPSTGTGPWSENVLLVFSGGDGQNPEGSNLTFDSSGNLYGTALYGGTAGNGVIFELSLQPTTTALVSSANPSTAGQAVTLTATVSPTGPPIPTGTVAFTSNATTITGCSAVALSSSRTATCVTTALPVGMDAIVATYSGDTNFGTSSGTLTQVVNIASTTTVTSSQNPSTSGDSVTLTATVSPGGPPVPTGTVEFSAMATTIGGCSAVALSSSLTAACTTSTLPVGTDAIVATYSGDSNYSSSSGSFSQLVNPIPTAVQFVPVTPCRVLDTRNADGPFGGPEIATGTSRSFAIPAGPCAGIPSTASAYSLNVTVVPPGPLGYVTIWPTGEGQPTVSTLNSLDGRTKANAAIVPAGTSGAVSVYANSTTNVVLDINGYFESGKSSGLEFYPLTPCRVADTRKADGPLGGPSLVAATERDFPILSSPCGIASGALAYSLNFTAIPPSGEDLGYVTVWPEGETMPLVSTLNDPTGTIVANAAIVPVGSKGGVAVYPSDATNLVIDVNGYFAAAGSGGLSLYALSPCRVLDTRKRRRMCSMPRWCRPAIWDT